MKILSCYIIAILLLLSPARLSAQTQTQPRTISTSGDATVYVVPDKAILTFGIQLAKSDLASAKTAVDSQSEKLSQAITKLGIERKNYATDNVEVSLHYKNETAYAADHTTISSYQVKRTYMVLVKDISQLQTVVDAVLNNGANIFDGVEFRTSKLREHRDTARGMAIKAAKEKAVALAGDLGCTIGSPRTITESGGHFGMFRSGRGAYSQVMQNVTQEQPSAPVAESGTMPLGQISINASVSVVFDLVPAT